MAKNTLLRLEEWDKPKCAGGQVLTALPAPISCRTVRSLKEPSQLTFRYLRDVSANDSVNMALPFNTVRQYLTNGTFREWEVIRTHDVFEEGGNQVEVVCAEQLIWLSRPGYIRSKNRSGSYNYNFSVDRRSVAQILNDYIIPALVDYELTWITVGTVEPLQRLTFDFERLTPLELLVKAAELAGNYEFEMVPNGLDTGYIINVVERIGAGSPVPSLRLGKNLRVLDQVLNVPEGFNVFQARGEVMDNGVVSTMARSVFRATAVDTIAKSVALEDPNITGTPPVITINSQLSHFYLVCRENRREYFINDTTTPNVCLLDSVDGISVGSTFELRATTGPDRIHTAMGSSARQPYFVTALDVPNRRITITERGSGGDAVPTNIAFAGRRYEILAFVNEKTTSWNAVTLEYNVPNVTGLAVGQIAVPIVNPTTPTGTGRDAFVIDAIDAVNNRLRMRRPYTYNRPLVTTNIAANSFRFYDILPGGHVLSADPTANTLDLDPNGILPAVDDGIHVFSPINGEQVDDLTLPTAIPPGGGRKFRTSQYEGLYGDVNLLGNGRMGKWSGGAHAFPDWPGVTVTTHADTKVRGLRNTNLSFIEEEQPYSLRLKLKGFGVTSGAAVVAGGNTFTMTDNTGSPFEVGDSVVFNQGGSPTETVVIQNVSTVVATHTYTIVGTFANPYAVGTVVREPGALGGTSIHMTLAFHPLYVHDDTAQTMVVRAFARNFAVGLSTWDITLNVTTGPDATVFGQFDQLALAGGTVTNPEQTVSLSINITLGSRHYTRELYVSYIGLIPALDVPAQLPDYSNGNALHRLAAHEMLDKFQLPAEVTVQVIDLHSIDSDLYPDEAFTLGGDVKIHGPYNPGATFTRRILQVDENNLEESDTNIVVSTYMKPLSQIVA